jgi:hypothetical protein
MTETLGTGEGRLWLLTTRCGAFGYHLLYAYDITVQLLKGKNAILQGSVDGTETYDCSATLIRLRVFGEIVEDMLTCRVDNQQQDGWSHIAFK